MNERQQREDAEETMRRLGLRPIAGGSDADAAGAGGGDGAGGDGAGAGGGQAGDTTPTAAELRAQERERGARLEGELLAERRARAEAGTSGPKRPEDLTAAELDEAGVAIENDATLTEGQKIRGLARVEALKIDRTRREREEKARPIVNAERKLDEYIDKYPDLNIRGSELLRKVSAEAGRLVRELGLADNDPRTQLLAVEHVVGGHQLGGGAGREFARRRIPVGGAGAGGGDGAGGGKPDPLKSIPKWQIDHWTGLGYTQAEMEAEAAFFKPHRRGAPA